MNGLTQIVIERPELIRVVNNVEQDLSLEVAIVIIYCIHLHTLIIRDRGSK